MTPEQVEARFQRIEAILLNNAEAIQANSEAIKANSEMIRANSEAIKANSEMIRANSEAIRANSEMIRANSEAIRANSEMTQANSEAIRAIQENVDLLLLSLDRLTQASINFERWKRENDLRFNTILQEIRAMNRRITRLENQ
jgi:uncharacterized protein YukE